jgi:hypothetical protein
MKPDEFCTELRNRLADYYEKVLDTEGASGCPLVKTFKHKSKEISPAPAPEHGIKGFL